MTHDVFVRELSFALQPTDHFSGLPVPEELAVSLDTPDPAVVAPVGGIRHADGSYRWINLATGAHTATVMSPSGRWVSWVPGPVSITLPLADPKQPVALELWPTPRASAPAGVSAVRGKLLGAGSMAGLRVSIDGTGAASLGKWTLTDDDGEFLYLLPGGPWPLTSAGLLDLTASVLTKSISGIAVTGGGTFVGSRFEVPPQREMRVRFQLA